MTLLAGAALLLGILGMTGEFRHQTVTQTFLATPTEGGWWRPNWSSYPLAGVAVALTTLAITAAVATGWLAVKGITPSLLDARLGRVVAGALLAAALFALLGVGVGALFRNQVAALVGTLVWVLLVEGLLINLLNAPSLAKWLPSAAAAAITNPGGDHLSRWAGMLLPPSTGWCSPWSAPAWSSAATSPNRNRPGAAHSRASSGAPKPLQRRRSSCHRSGHGGR